MLNVKGKYKHSKIRSPHIPTNSWFSVALVMDYAADTITSYHQGNKMEGFHTSHTAMSGTNQNKLILGKSYTGASTNNRGNCALDEIRVYDRPLTENQVMMVINSV